MLQGGVPMAQYKRKKVLLHASSQVKFILVSVVPALLAGILCVQVLFMAGERMLEQEIDNIGRRSMVISQRVSSATQILVKKQYPADMIANIKDLINDLTKIERSYKENYLGMIDQWNLMRLAMMLIILIMSCFVSIIALLHSHRIAGPLYRMRKSIDMMAQGQDVANVVFRRKDEFKELGQSLERLRSFLAQKGLLK
jgi:nitrogen fixation/metabolism regulation signal transduction histidine kinase